MDLGVASVLALVLLPLLALVAALVKLSSSGPLIVRQPHVGRNGELFTLYEVRTMDAGADSPRHPGAARDGEVTRLGRLMRSLGLNELPRLWNVIRGDMSLVGPRPLPLPEALAHPELRRRHLTPPGLTGWWQVSGKTALTPQQIASMDRFYEENWSLSLDAYILVKTIGHLFRTARPRPTPQPRFQVHHRLANRSGTRSLTEDEVEAAWTEFKVSRTPEAWEKLILHYVPLVRDVARRVAAEFPLLTDEDLAQYGIFGLIEAIETWVIEPRKGDFGAHAVNNIETAIRDELDGMNSDS
jgi:lipopolysaccharide/colanic/teichoic acid biosynthesis glycosyltransferase